VRGSAHKSPTIAESWGQQSKTEMKEERYPRLSSLI
jgi:hypothetical protein